MKRKKTTLFLVLGLALLLLGVFLGQPAFVFRKGSFICTECIGIG